MKSSTKRKKSKRTTPQYAKPKGYKSGRDHPPAAGVIAVIAGGLSGGETNSARKSYARQPQTEDTRGKRPRTDESITFTDEDLEGILTPHDDPLVISLTIANYEVKMVLVDNGSLTDILFYDAFEKMSIGRELLKPVKTPLVGFTREVVEPEGIITLPLIAGDRPQQATVMIDFLVVRVPSSYNVILGRPGLNKMRAIVSTYHMLMQFPTKHGVGRVRGDQGVARQCYVTSLKGKTKSSETLAIESLEPEDKGQKSGELVEDLVSIPLYEGN
ncbi:hypothetical protein DH2020_020321 [Rehmannia glutinosa]|uniref:Reverse transcriptase domain-containing protein n=1 Tax=Rehmannia glutinosa TaxID=99300 RepID=A0ABR0WGC5_REHGL